MTITYQSRPKPLWAPMLTMGVSALLALWLLWRPELLSTLALPIRLPLMALGIWALGSGFMQGAGLKVSRGWPRRLLGPPACWWALGAFTLILMIRAWWLT